MQQNECILLRSKCTLSKRSLRSESWIDSPHSAKRKQLWWSYTERYFFWWWIISIPIKGKSWTTVAHTKRSAFYYGEDILKKLGCKPVAAENIILKPKLLKKVTDKFAKCRQNNDSRITSKQGWILRIQKFRTGIDSLLSCANLLLNVL